MYDYKTDEWQGTAGVARSGGTPFPSLEEWAINSGFRDKAIALARSDKPGVNDPVAAVFLELDTYARKSVDLHDTIAEQEITEALNAVTPHQSRHQREAGHSRNPGQDQPARRRGA